MSKTLVLTFGTLALVAGMASATTARAETNRYNLRGKQALASYYSFDGCSSVYFQVLGAENFQKSEPGAPVRPKVGQVFGSFDSFCGEANYGWIEFSAQSAVQFQNNMSAASVEIDGTGIRTTCVWDPNVFYYVCSSESVALTGSVSWTASGSVERMSTAYTHSSANLLYRYRSSGNSRPAAVSGEVSIGDDTYSLTEVGQILTSNQSELFVTHP